jgi:hypothetical protein
VATRERTKNGPAVPLRVARRGGDRAGSCQDRGQCFAGPISKSNFQAEGGGSAVRIGSCGEPEALEITEAILIRDDEAALYFYV